MNMLDPTGSKLLTEKKKKEKKKKKERERLVGG